MIKKGKIIRKKINHAFGRPYFKFLNEIILNDAIHFTVCLQKASLGKYEDDAKTGIRGGRVS